ncbi:MAG: hypothetical protein ACI8SE_001005 [Bacteroidia bacterium]|jgi:hypothetical protein
MSTITVKTHINAPTERVFDLSRSIDLHQISTQQPSEKAIGGKTSGLIGLNETVTWKAKHFGMYHTNLSYYRVQSTLVVYGRNSKRSIQIIQTPASV